MPRAKAQGRKKGAQKTPTKNEEMEVEGDKEDIKEEMNTSDLAPTDELDDTEEGVEQAVGEEADDAAEEMLLAEDDQTAAETEDNAAEETEEANGNTEQSAEGAEGEGGEGDDEEGDEEEEEDEDGDEDEESETKDNKQTKRKKAQDGKKEAKKAKVDQPAMMNVYATCSSEEVFTEAFKGFLTENELEVKGDITSKSSEKKWEWFCQIELVKPEDKEKFLALNGKEVDGREVKFEEIKDADIDDLNAPPECVLFVGNIPRTATESDLRTLYPTAKEIIFPMSRYGQKRGFAFIELPSKEEVEEIIKTRKGEKMEGNELSVGNYFPKKKKDNRSKKSDGSGKKVLFIGNLNYNTTQERLKGFFTNAVSARILRQTKTGKSKGVGFIEFKTSQDAQKALKQQNGATVDDREIFLEFADSEPSTAADYRSGGRFSGRQSGGGPRQGYRQNYGGGGGYGGGMGFGGGGRFMDNYESRLLQSRFGGYGFGDGMGFDGGGFSGGMGFGGGYGSGQGGGYGGYGQRNQGGGARGFKSNRSQNRGRRF